jgi:hypothetical protein
VYLLVVIEILVENSRAVEEVVVGLWRQEKGEAAGVRGRMGEKLSRAVLVAMEVEV